MSPSPFCWNRWKAAKKWVAIPLSASGPIATILARGKLHRYQRARQEPVAAGGCLRPPKRAAGGQKPARIAGLAAVYCRAVGFFAYDVVRQMERLPELAEGRSRRPGCLPDVFRRGAGVRPCAQADPAHRDCGSRPAEARSRVCGCEEAAGPAGEAPGPAHPEARPAHPEGKLSVTSHTLKKDFLASVARSRSTLPPATSSRPCFRSALK